ncbi:dynein axonemal intermediate chain 7 homolog [Helicoverpa zea]|uniref:dynein axonemal intermediate chain 7 homolog n=1 Tax=Helicoverpa zea TaxID=7113 RepID=UPI001F5A27D1|nr:dynein axonemal intermediate chain 7 homolog [Helicoverpa zea]
MAKKKDKKKKEAEPQEAEVPEEVVVMTTDLEPEPEEIQFTDTSYTSASFEDLPPMPIEELKPKKKKKKKLGEQSSVVKKTSSELFAWSEESLPRYPDLSTLEPKPVLPSEQPVEKKKGKKGKKDKGKEEEIPAFDKPKAWKKMNKKEREAWLVQRIEDWRAEKEAAKQAILAGAKEKRAAAAKARNELMAREIAEQDVRRDVLQKAVNLFQRFEKQKLEYELKKEQDAEWQQYLRCDGLPDPRVVTEMNTFLHLWQQTEICDDNELDKKFIEVLPILDMLEIFRFRTRQYTERQIQNYDEVRLALRAELANAIQMASYNLLRDIERNLVSESTKVSTYQREFKGLRLNIWVAVKWPTRKPKPVPQEPEPVELSFPSMKVTVKLPKIIDGSCVCVRAARSLIDLLSESSRSFALKAPMPKLYEDLFTFNVKELIDTQKLKKEQDEFRSKFFKEVRERIKELEAFIKANVYLKNDKEKEDLENLNMAEPPFMPPPREQIAYNSEREFKRYLRSCRTRTRTGELNLRKYRICGGVLNLDLLVTPPQPKRMRHAVTITTLQLPKCLQPMKYQVQYRAPAPPPPGVTRTPEEIEQEIKKVEAQYEKLAMVFIELPQDVMWNEPPVVVQWQDGRKIWTSSYVNDYKFNEDKLNIQFRTGVLWPIGIATLRYSNLPYQGWDLKPDPDGRGVLITVTGLCVTVTWLCVSNFVKLKSIANASTTALSEHFNKPYSVKAMVKLMRDASCDFFPDFDAHNHVEGSTPKEWVMERHTYHAMSFLSRAYNFQSSRWNQGAGYRTIVLQARENVDKKRSNKLQLMTVSPERATVLQCNELSPEFNYEPQVGLPFFPGLFTFNMLYGSVDARRMTFNMKYKLVETVFEMLQEIKPCSYS